MPDRHIRRYCADYTQALADLLPFGLAWPRHLESITMHVVHGLSCIWEFVDGRAADLLEIESDPRTTTELLPDWERNWGLPDPCFPPNLTIDQRRKFLVQRMTLLGGQSRAFFIDVARQLGYDITITEYRPFMVGLDVCGDGRVYGDGTQPYHSPAPPWWYDKDSVQNTNGQDVGSGELSEWPNYGLGPIENRYYWTVHVHQASLAWFRCGSGQCGVDPHLRIGLAEDLECVLNRWKPAHTQIIFDYTSVHPGDPMEGTP